jgi:DNA transformation protein
MTPECRAWLLEMFAPLGAVSLRRVFGVYGLYLGDAMFGLVADERIYLKTDETSRMAFEHSGSHAWTYAARNGERNVTSYWEIPAALYDEPEELASWARQAHDIALNSPTAKRRQARKAKQEKARPPVKKRKGS